MSKRKTIRESAEENRNLVYKTIRCIETQKGRSLFKPISLSEILEHVSGKGLKSRRNVRRYLDYLRDDKKVFHLSHNQYVSNVIHELKTIVEGAVTSRFMEKVDVWDTKAMWDAWKDILDIHSEWGRGETAEIMYQVDDWMKEHLVVYLATPDEILDASLDHSAMHYLLKFIETITTMSGVLHPLLSDKGFKMIVSFEPTALVINPSFFLETT